MFISKRKNGFWYVWFENEHGRRVKRSTGAKTKSEALRYLKTFEQELINKKTTAPKQIFFKSFFEKFIAYSRSTHTEATQSHFQTAANEWLRLMGNTKLREIDPRMIEKFLTTKTAEASVWTSRKYHISLASMMERARQWGYVDSNPFRQVKRPRPPQTVPIFFTKAEAKTFPASIYDPQWQILVEVGFLTGLRLGELLSLTWSDLDFEKKQAHVRNKNGWTTKSKKNRSIPMHPRVAELLSPLKDQAKWDLVFQREGGLKIRVSNASIKFKSLLKKSHLPEKRKKELHTHSMRHSFATWMLQNGAEIYAVSKLLRHSSVKVTEVYAHARPQEFGDAVARLSL